MRYIFSPQCHPQIPRKSLKNEATPTMLLKKHLEKMSVLVTPTIFMKTSDSSRYSHDIHENKGSCAPRLAAPEGAQGSAREAEISPAIAHFRQGEQKRIIKYTFETGMSMKTKDRKTQCPKINRLLIPRFRHLRRIERYFAENCCFATTSCQAHSVFHGFIRG
jgi:hypothetical protein